MEEEKDTAVSDKGAVDRDDFVCLTDIGLANSATGPHAGTGSGDRLTDIGLGSSSDQGHTKPTSQQLQATTIRRKRKKHLGWIVAELLFLYVLISPLVLMPFCSSMLFCPDKNLPDATQVIDTILDHFKGRFSEVHIKTPSGPVLHGWHFKLPNARRTFLINHGNAGNIYYRIPHVNVILQSGCSVFLYDYQGYGKSEGEPNMMNVLDDSLFVYDFVTKTLGVTERELVLYGESIGCAVTCSVSRQRHPGAIVLQSPFSSLREAAADKLPWFRLYPPFVWSGPVLDNAAAMADIHPPLLIIHGAKDTILPCRYSEEIMARAAEPKRFVKLPNAGHNDVTMVDLEVLMPAVMKFVANLPN